MPLTTDQKAWLRAQSLRTSIPPSDHILMLFSVDISPLAQEIIKPQMTLCWENILDAHQCVFLTSGTAMDTCATPQGCLQALTSTKGTAARYCSSGSRSGVGASQQPNRCSRWQSCEHGDSAQGGGLRSVRGRRDLPPMVQEDGPTACRAVLPAQGSSPPCLSNGE